MQHEKRAERAFVVDQIGRLIDAFPHKENAFYKTLTERILANNFTEEKLIRAIDYVIDHTEAYQLSVASVMKAKNEIEENETNRFRLHPAFSAGYGEKRTGRTTD
jgi:hypothetical protein